MRGPGAERWVLRGLALAALLALAGERLGWLGLVGALAVLAWGSGWLLARRVVAQASPARLALLGIVLSPSLAGGLATVLELAGLVPAVAARALLAGFGAWALLEGLTAPGPRDPDPAPAVRLYGPALLWAGVMAMFLLGNPYLLPRSDGWFHAAVVERVAQLGLPPEDPFFAGERLLYFWGYHVWGGLLLALFPAAGPLLPLAVFNLIAAFAVLVGVALLACRLGGARLVWLACAVAALGYYPGAWLWIVVRCFTGDVVGWTELERLVTNGVTPALQVMRAGTMHASMVSFADKFLVLTPFSMAQALFLVFLLVFLDFVERPTVRAGLLLGLVQMASLFLHSVAGWAQALCAALWWCWAATRAPRDREARGRLVPLAAVFVLATLLVLPYLWVTTHGKSGALGFRFSPVALSSLLVAGSLFLAASLPVLAGWARSRGAGRELLAPAAALVLAGLLIRLPENNQSKFLNLLFLMLAPPAAEGLSALWRQLSRPGRTALAAAGALAVLPTTALVLWGFASEHGQTVDTVPDSTPAELAAFEWCRRHTDPRTAFADATGGEDLVVRAGRGSLWGGHGYEDNWGYPMGEMRLRERAVRQLAAGVPPDPEVSALLRALGRPVVVVARRRDAARPGSAWRSLTDRSPYRLLYANAEVRLYGWEAAP